MSLLREVYEQMLAISAILTPKEQRHIFAIDYNKSQDFWADKLLNHEQNELHMEWESPKAGTYHKVFLGVKFGIIFNYTKQPTT